MYENIITQMVSNGYIVIGINSLLISGDAAFPGNRVVSMAEVDNWNVVARKTLPTLEQAIEFVYKKIHDEAQDAVFAPMDLNHIAGLGHSFSERAITNVFNKYRERFQALATLDMEVRMGSFEPEKLMVPSMHIISAYWRSAFDWQRLRYPLNKYGYLVTLSPTKYDRYYGYHMNFTDFQRYNTCLRIKPPWLMSARN